MLTAVSRMGRKCGKELARKTSPGFVVPAFEPTPEKVRNLSSIPHLWFLSVGPNGSSRPLATLNTFPRSTKTALAPGILITVLESSKDAAEQVNTPHHTHHLHTTTTHHSKKVCLENPLETRVFGELLASDFLMMTRAI